MRGLGRLIMYSQAIHSWKQDKFQASNQKMVIRLLPIILIT